MIQPTKPTLHPVGEALLAARGATANAVLKPEEKGASLSSTPVQEQANKGKDSNGFVRLFALWLFMQCFLFTELGYSINIGITLSPDRILYLVLIVLFLTGSKRVSRPLSAIEWMMIVFTVVTTISWFVGGADWVERKLRWLTTLITLCYQPFFGYYIARRLPWDRRTLTKLLWGIAIIGIYLGLTGVFEHFEMGRFVFPKYILDPRVGVQFGRARGPFAASVVNGGALIVCFLSATFLWCSQTGMKKLLILLGVMAPIALSIYFTDTRGVWVGFGVTLALMAFTRSQMRKFGLYVVAFAAVVYVSGVFSKFSLWEESLFSKRAETVDYRWANYATTYTMFQKNPLFGIGYGNFNRMWRQYFSTTDDSAEIRDLADGNNTTFLAILGEEGLVGFSAYFAIFLCAIKVCRDALSRLKGENWELERRFVVVAAGSLAAFLFMGITTDVRFHSFFNVSLFLLMGISSSLNAANAQGNESSPSSSENESPRVMLRPLASTRP